MWDLPGPGLKPVSPALAGGFLTTAPPGKPYAVFFTLVEEGLVSLKISRTADKIRFLNRFFFGYSFFVVRFSESCILLNLS